VLFARRQHIRRDAAADLGLGQIDRTHGAESRAVPVSWYWRAA
jgi:hypothetical protein